MPYKNTGQWVMVKKKGRWRKFKKHPSSSKAARHARALNANVRHKR